MKRAIHIMCGLIGLVGLSPAEAADTPELGRLFFTPAERARIDHPPKAGPPPVPPPRLDGIITRSAGAPTLFLDGRATLANPRQVNAGDGTARITGPDGRSHRLRVGDPPPESSPP